MKKTSPLIFMIHCGIFRCRVVIGFYSKDQDKSCI